MKRIIFIKLGGGLITDKHKPFVAKRNVIKRLALEVKQAIKNTDIGLVIAHGSGSFGHTAAAKYKIKEGLKNKINVWGVSVVSDAAIKINRIVMEEFLKVQLPVISFAPKSFILSKKDQKREIFEQPVMEALKIGLIPVVYGDVVMDTEKGCGILSSEMVITELVKKLKPLLKIEKIIYCGNTEGVYDSKQSTIPIIDSNIYKRLAYKIGGSSATDVTGGMLHKVQEAMKVAKIIKGGVVIMSGLKIGDLNSEIRGSKTNGTQVKS